MESAKPVVMETEISRGLRAVVKTLEAQKSAVAELASQTKNDEWMAQAQNALEVFYSVKRSGNKIVLCGMGKSSKIAAKITATLNSLSILSVNLHPTEALHGDLGVISDKDCLFFLSASGNTPELLNLLPHISKTIPLVVLTCNLNSKLVQHPQTKAVLYTDLPDALKEESIHGVPAPTVAASLALILADSLVLALAEMLNSDALARKKLFSMKHPGGSIGANLSHLNDNIVLTKSQSSSSYSSILSLDQLRGSLTHAQMSNSTSLVSSDDESPTLTATACNDLRLSATESAFCQIPYSTAGALTELQLLKLITLKDYIVLNKKETQVAIESSIVRKLYVRHQSNSETWDQFMDTLLKNFRPVRFY